MIVKCDNCTLYYDDEFRTTICPHETFMANDGKNNFKYYINSYIGNNPPKDKNV